MIRLAPPTPPGFVAPPRRAINRQFHRWVTELHTLRLLALAALLALGGCSTIGSWFGGDEDAKEDPATVPVEDLYNRGVDALTARRYSVAVKEFDTVEQYYPYSSWATNAELMQGYSQYLRKQIHGCHRHARPLYPAPPGAPRHRLRLSICARYAITSRSPISRAISAAREQAMTALQEVVNRFPDSAYGRDARLKIDLARDHLAGKEMDIGRYYEKQHLYAAAIGRFQKVVDDYQTTNHVPEALHRLTEIYLILGLTDQARKTAAVLGHNYPGSEWYVDSYNQLIADGQVKGTQVSPTGGPVQPGFFSRTWLRSSDGRAAAPPMLTALSIRDVVLIERLDLSFGPGLTVLTGETGAGKSILLDSLGLALGARAEAGLVRAGAEQATVAAVFAPPPDHPAFALLAEQGIEAEDEIVLRRVLARRRPLPRVRQRPAGGRRRCCAGSPGCWWRCRASTTRWALRMRAAMPALLDAYDVPPALREAVAAGHGTPGARRRGRSPTPGPPSRRRSATRNVLRHAVDELSALAPAAGRGGPAGAGTPAIAARRETRGSVCRRALGTGAARPPAPAIRPPPCAPPAVRCSG